MKSRHISYRPTFRLILFILAFGFSETTFSQNFQWLRTDGSKINGLIIHSISAEETGGCTYLVAIDSVFNLSGLEDTVRFDSTKFILKGGYASYLVRVDSTGKVSKARQIGNFEAVNMCRDNFGNYYLTGGLIPSCHVDSVYMSSSNGKMVFAKFDKDFNFMWVKQTGNSKSTFGSRIIFSDGHLYFNCTTLGNTKIGITNYSFGSGYTYVFGELNKSNGEVVWSNFLFNNNIKNQTNLVISDMINLKGKLFMSVLLNDSNVLIRSDTLFAPGGAVIQADTLGNYERSFVLHNGKNTKITSLASDGQNLYIGGSFRDTLKWNSKTIVPEESYQSKMFIASLTLSLKPIWFYRPKIPANNNGGSFIEE